MVIFLAVQGIEEEQSIGLQMLLTVPNIPLKAASIPCDEDLTLMKHLQGVSICDPIDTPDQLKRFLAGHCLVLRQVLYGLKVKSVCSMHIACDDKDEVCRVFEDKFVDTLAGLTLSTRSNRLRKFGIIKTQSNL